MLLEGEVALGVAILLIDEVDGRLTVQLDDDVVAFGDDFLREPLIGLDELIVDEHLLFLRGAVAVAAIGVKAAGADLVAVGRVDLSLVARGEGLGELGAEILAAVALVVDLGLDAEAEVLIVAALAEEVAGGTAADDKGNS